MTLLTGSDQPDTNSTYLVRFNQTSNITFTKASFVSVRTPIDHILGFTWSQNITVNQLVASDCLCGLAVLAFQNSIATDALASSGFTLNNSQVVDTTAGALSVIDGSAAVINSVFDNLASWPVPTVDIRNHEWSEFVMKSCTLSNNYRGGQSADNDSWGTLRIQTGLAYVLQSAFLNNSCTVGGAIAVLAQNAAGDYFEEQQVIIQGCRMSSNTATAEGGGGAIYMAGSAGAAHEKLYISDCLFKTNAALTGPGGAMTLWGVTTAVLDGSVFQNNSALYAGAALYVYGFPRKYTNLTITSSEFIDSSSSCLVYAWSVSCVGVLNSTFANSNSSGLCLNDVSGDCEKIDNPTLFNRNAIASDVNNSEIFSIFGQDISEGISVDIRHTAFSQLTRVLSGSTDVSEGYSGLVIEACRGVLLAFIDASHNVGLRGAGISIVSASVAVVWSSTFKHNVAAYEGGAVAMLGVYGKNKKGLFILNCSLSNNSALSGGAIFTSPGTTLTVSHGTTAANNSAVTTGGALQGTTARLVKLQDAKLESNSASGAGGGFHCAGCIQVQVDNSQLLNNRCAFTQGKSTLCTICSLEGLTRQW